MAPGGFLRISCGMDQVATLEQLLAAALRRQLAKSSSNPSKPPSFTVTLAMNDCKAVCDRSIRTGRTTAEVGRPSFPWTEVAATSLEIATINRCAFAPKRTAEPPLHPHGALRKRSKGKCIL